MKARIVVTDADIREAIAKFILEKLALVIMPCAVKIQVKSRNNYKSQEWEEGLLQCEFDAEPRN